MKRARSPADAPGRAQAGAAAAAAAAAADVSLSSPPVEKKPRIRKTDWVKDPAKLARLQRAVHAWVNLGAAKSDNPMKMIYGVPRRTVKRYVQKLAVGCFPEYYSRPQEDDAGGGGGGEGGGRGGASATTDSDGASDPDGPDGADLDVVVRREEQQQQERCSAVAVGVAGRLCGGQAVATAADAITTFEMAAAGLLPLCQPLATPSSTVMLNGHPTDVVLASASAATATVAVAHSNLRVESGPTALAALAAPAPAPAAKPSGSSSPSSSLGLRPSSPVPSLEDDDLQADSDALFMDLAVGDQLFVLLSPDCDLDAFFADF